MTHAIGMPQCKRVEPHVYDECMVIQHVKPDMYSHIYF